MRTVDAACSYHVRQVFILHKINSMQYVGGKFSMSLLVTTKNLFS